MKRLLLLSLFLLPLILDAQISIFAEYALDPFKGYIDNFYEDFDKDPSVIKEINLGLNYKFRKRLSLRVGVSRFEKREARSLKTLREFFDPSGRNLRFRHDAQLRNYAVFVGIQLDLNRFHIASHLHYSRSIFKDSNIIAREVISQLRVKESFYPIAYDDIDFYKFDFNIYYDILKGPKAALAIVIKGIYDISSNERFTVRSLSSEVKELMIQDFPTQSICGSNFIEGGNLFYDHDFVGIGFRMTYNLGEVY